LIASAWTTKSGIPWDDRIDVLPASNQIVAAL
jgi:hypothetical protein